jgi:hypothetical protein
MVGPRTAKWKTSRSPGRSSKAIPRRAFARGAYVEMQPTVGPQIKGEVDEWNSDVP